MNIVLKAFLFLHNLSSRKAFIFFTSILSFTFYSHSLKAEDAAKAEEESTFESLVSRVEKTTLENGVRVLYLERTLTPVFVGQVWVKVGSSDEEPGKSGAAHLLEHMAFKGTETIGTDNFEDEKILASEEDQLHSELLASTDNEKNKEISLKIKNVEEKLAKITETNKFSELYQKRGAVGLNAGTSADYTMYTSSLPSSELEFWMFMESERLLKPVFRQFYKELEVVKEERRMRFDDVPTGKLIEGLMSTAYWGHPYQNLTIGWPWDLHNLKRQDAIFLHQKYYRPDNLTIVLVGDLRGHDYKSMISKYFGRLKKPKEELTFRNSGNISNNYFQQSGEKQVFVKYDAEPFVLSGYHIPNSPNPDAVLITILHSLLTDGPSSILEKKLVIDSQVFTSVLSTEWSGQRFDPLFIVGGSPKKNISSIDAINQMEKEIINLSKVTVPLKDFEAAKKRVRQGLIKSISSAHGIADILGSGETVLGDYKKLLVEEKIIKESKPEDIKRIVTKYFTRENRTVAVLDKKGYSSIWDRKL